MKRHLKDAILKNREIEIIKIVKENPYCSLDTIFTKGRIPKSKVTIELVNRLVAENKIQSSITKNRYYVGEDNWIKEFELVIKASEADLKKDPKYDNDLSRKILEFQKIRLRVLKSEEKHDKNLNISDTLDIFFNYIVPYNKNPSELGKIVLMDLLNFAIKDDKYYLTHELHSNPTNKKRKFHKAEIGVRRSVENLIDMKNKGRQEYGLIGIDFKKNMAKLTNDPHVWMDKYYAEENRTLYQNSPELKNKIQKKMLDGIKLTPDMPDYENRKKY